MSIVPVRIRVRFNGEGQYAVVADLFAGGKFVGVFAQVQDRGGPATGWVEYPEAGLIPDEAWRPLPPAERMYT